MTKQKELCLHFDVFITLIKEHVISDSRKGVLLVHIFRLNFRPF